MSFKAPYLNVLGLILNQVTTFLSMLHESNIIFSYKNPLKQVKNAVLGVVRLLGV